MSTGGVQVSPLTEEDRTAQSLKKSSNNLNGLGGYDGCTCPGFLVEGDSFIFTPPVPFKVSFNGPKSYDKGINKI
jgi:hypothetical protein